MTEEPEHKKEINPEDVASLRGFEVARWRPDEGRWSPVKSWGPTAVGHRHASSYFTRCQEKHPNRRYALRVLVSIDPPRPAAQEAA